MALSPSPSRLSALSSVECNQISNAPPASLLFDFRAAEKSRRGKGWERVPLPSFAQKHKGQRVWKTWQYRDKRVLGDPRSAGEESEEIEEESVMFACSNHGSGVELEDMTIGQSDGHKVEAHTLDKDGRAGKKRRLTVTLPIGEVVWHATMTPAVACPSLHGGESDCKTSLGKSEISSTEGTDTAPDMQTPSVDQKDSASQASYDDGLSKFSPGTTNKSVHYNPVFDAFLMPASAAARYLLSGAKRKHDEIDSNTSGQYCEVIEEKPQPEIDAVSSNSSLSENGQDSHAPHPLLEAEPSEPAESPQGSDSEVEMASPDEPAESLQLHNSCDIKVDEEGRVDELTCTTADNTTKEDSISCAHETVADNLILPSTPPPIEESEYRSIANTMISPKRPGSRSAETGAETQCISEDTRSALENDDSEPEQSTVEEPERGAAAVAQDDQTNPIIGDGVGDEVHDEAIVAQPDQINSTSSEPSCGEFSAQKGAQHDSPVPNIHETPETVQPDVSEPESGAISADQPVRVAPSISSYLQDDTDMLKGFLDRVKAGKAAKAAAVTVGTEEVKSIASPDPRTPLEDRDKNASSPRDGSDDKDLTNKQKKRKKELPGPDAIVQEQEEAGTFRRSKRLRATDASKALSVAPSLIPRFRPDGSEPLVLQKTAAQELTILTRLNTRRNKGRPCTTVLRAQNAEKNQPPDEVPCTSKKGKAVTWDEKLEYFQDGPKEERKKKASATVNKRRVNGTPARKCRVKAVDRMACV